MSVTAAPIEPVKTSYKIWLWCGIVLAAVFAFGLAWSGTRPVVAITGTAEQFLDWNKTQSGVQTSASGLQYRVIKKGSGSVAEDRDGISLSFKAIARDGSSSRPKSSMNPFRVGSPDVPPGINEAAKLMNKGETLRVWLPPKLIAPDGQRPPELDDVLIFDLTLDEITPAAQIDAMQSMAPPPGGPGGAAGGN